MTGFGRATQDTPLGQFSVEIKSVNHRYCSFDFALPSGLSFLEPRLQELFRTSIQRGRVSVSVQYLPNESVATQQVRVDKALVTQYQQVLEALKAQIGGEGDLTLGEWLQLPGVLLSAQGALDEERTWACLAPVLQEALQQFQTMRAREGEQTRRTLESLLRQVRSHLARIQENNAEQLPLIRERLRERLQSLLEGLGEIDETRLVMEAGLLADKMDVTEEVSRLESHCHQFEQALEGEGPVGRRLDFLLQEMYREVNTLASKNRDQAIASLCVQLKVDVEKMRELVQNVE